MTDALINLRVPAALKARWVRESRAAGMRLTDWIVERVEAPTMTTSERVAIGVPSGLKFADLKLARNPQTGDVSFDASVIARPRVSGRLRHEPAERRSPLSRRWR